MTMTSIERISNILQCKPVDRIGLFEHFWGDTFEKWTSQGHVQKNEKLEDHFNFDMSGISAFNLEANLDKADEVIEEYEDTILIRDGNYATLRTHKQHNATPEHVGFEVMERNKWEELIKPLLTPEHRRINFSGYREAKQAAAAKQRFFCWKGVNVFESMHPVCGHEYMLMGMALDPDWIRDMVDAYAQLTIDLMEILFAEKGQPDGIWFYEDMGFKGCPFMSPQMYKEIIHLEVLFLIIILNKKHFCSV